MQPLKIGDLAKKTGITVRTLRYYDEIELLPPSHRSPGGHRLYSAADIEKLQRILSLQSMGLSLTDIQAAINNPAFSLIEVLTKHMGSLQQDIEQKQALFKRLDYVVQQLEHQQTVSTEDILTTIEVTVMYEKYYTPEQMEYLKEREASMGKDKIKQVETEWETVFAGIIQACNENKDVTDKSVLDLGKKANKLVSLFTGDKPDVKQSFQNMYKENGAGVLQQHGIEISQEAFDYLRQAMLAARDAS